MEAKRSAGGCGICLMACQAASIKQKVYVGLLANDVFDALRKWVALVGDKQPQQALDDAAKAWEGITDRFGRDQQKAFWSKQNDALKKLGIVYRPELAGS